MRRYYPQMLVFLQFAIIFAMIVLMGMAPVFSWIGTVLFLLGVWVGIWAMQHNRPGNFNIIPELKEGCCLVTTGIYRYIRHPMYTSVILMLLGIVCFSSTGVQWLLWAALIGVLYLKAHREERLWCAHDASYEIYRKNTKYFIPYIL
jgi:protein-S-isoprenylcysteine O-methyltransferase Ste14